MRQLVYISSVVPALAAGIDMDALLAQSRRDNAAAQVTGVLFFNGKRFLQAIEGDDAAVAETFARIRRDPRHRALVVLSNRVIPAREFGEWTMAYAPTIDDDGTAIARVAALVAQAGPSIRATFEGFAEIRRAA